ncbi:unnamed protein product [Heligmosomoides polygyrus]|uniref:Reverse transcriptase domain-containing protein n=1 Tax=Heligmosomoides polygyrus TaxID=6339 RepID=A0A183F7F1_HELPZ|nr:unnamed protein product [Heligmosomoides polygyrus]
MPHGRRDSIMVPIFKKKGDASDGECSNYRRIKLTSYTMKGYERLVGLRLKEMVTISREQWGEGDGHHLPGAVGLHAREVHHRRHPYPSQVMEKYREKRKPCYLAFLDLEKANDRLSRAVLWKFLRGEGVLERLIIKDMCECS